MRVAYGRAFRRVARSGLSVNFNAKMLAVPSSLASCLHLRLSSRTVHQDGAIVLLDHGQFGTTWDSVQSKYCYETEPAATNLATNSEGAAATFATSNVTNAGTPITGFAQSLAFGANTVQREALKSINLTSGTAYSIAFYIQMDDGNAPVIGSTNTTGDLSLVMNNSICTTNPLVKKVGSTGSLYRVSASRTASSTSSQYVGMTKYTGQSSRTFKVVGIQIETGVRATSYIPTTSSTVTRAIDTLIAGHKDFPTYSLAGYTLYVQCRRDAVISTNLSACAVTNGTTANRANISINASNVEEYAVNSNSVSQVLVSGGTPALAVRRRALSVSLNNFLCSVNGASGTADTSVKMPLVFTNMYIGGQNGVVFNGLIYDFAFVPTVETQAQLNARTT